MSSTGAWQCVELEESSLEISPKPLLPGSTLAPPAHTSSQKWVAVGSERQQRESKMEDRAGLGWGEAEDGGGGIRLVEQCSPGTPPPPTHHTPPAASYLPSPASWNQTAFRGAGQVLNASNGFHYQCSTIR